MPAVLVVLAMSIFPLLISLYLSLSRFKFVKGGFDISFVGFLNYKKLLFGSQQFHFLGTFGEMSPVAWLVIGLAGVALAGMPAVGDGYGSPGHLARRLFTDYLVPFEITSVLLLVAIVGAVVLGKRRI